jgi:hypothetical protein
LVSLRTALTLTLVLWTRVLAGHVQALRLSATMGLVVHRIAVWQASVSIVTFVAMVMEMATVSLGSVQTFWQGGSGLGNVRCLIPQSQVSLVITSLQGTTVQIV